MTPQDTLRRYDSLESERAAKDEVIDLIDRFVIPGRGQLYTTSDENAIDWKHRELYDETAGLAAQTLSASIHGAMTSPAIKWFQFAFKNAALNSDPIAAAWLGKARDLIYTDLMDSNFNTEVIETYLSDVTYGDAVLGHQIDRATGSDYFRNHDVRHCFYEMDYRDQPVGLFVKREYTVNQIQKEFGWLPDTLQEIQDESPDRAAIEKREVVHAIYYVPENALADISVTLAPGSRPYKEEFILVEGAEVLNKEDLGYYEFPAYVLRWGRVAGSKHSYSPAINCLGTILSLNQLIEVILGQAEKAVDPPVLTVDRGIIGDVDLRAGGQTTVRSLDAVREFITNGRFDVSQLERQQLINSIRSSFYIDQLELKESPAMTATEANIRYELMQRLLGPSLTRIRIDLLDRLLTRKFHSAMRLGRIDQPPQIVAELQAQYDIEYIGPWSRAQKADSVMAMEQSLMYVAQLAGSVNMPQLLDNFELDDLMRQIAIERGMAPKFIRDKKVIEAERAAKLQQQQEMQEMQMAESAARASKDFAAAGETSEQPQG
jgi:hypothetical protein